MTLTGCKELHARYNPGLKTWTCSIFRNILAVSQTMGLNFLSLSAKVTGNLGTNFHTNWSSDRATIN